MYDFDKVIERRGSACIKHDGYAHRGKSEDMVSLWVADMDFETAPAICAALKKRCDHGIYGYTMADDAYFEAVQGWYQRRFNYSVQKDWIVNSPGIVFALNCAIRSFTKTGDAVLIQRPVYYPFSMAIEGNGRTLINSPLVYKDNAYTINFTDFEHQIVSNKVKLFILCNPHNPVGRVWTRDELTAMGDICLKHNVTVIADEIHSDFVHKGTHIMFASIKPEFEQIAVTCTSPSKTFNLAGLQISNMFIANEALREAFKTEMSTTGYGEPNIFGLTAVKAAYTEGEDWLEALLVYIRQNAQRINQYLAEHLPKVRMIELEGTYLVWLDFSAYALSEDELENRIQNKAKLWLDGGTMFGPEGVQFQRVNIACPWSILEKALANLKAAF